MTDVRVIPLTEKYIPGALAVARAIHPNSLYWDSPLNGEKLIKQLLAAETDDSPDRWFRIAVVGERVVGGFYGCWFRGFFTTDRFIKDLGWWVSPEYRSRGVAQALLFDFEEWGRFIGAKKCMIGYNGLEDIEEKRRVFEYYGYTVTGYNTVKEL